MLVIHIPKSWKLKKNHINEKKRDKSGSDLCFIHIPKNAGNSIRELIYKKDGYKFMDHNTFYLLSGSRVYGESDIDMEEFRKNICKKSPLSDLRFAIVRDPYERFLSAYQFLIKGGVVGLKSDLFYKNILEKYASLDAIVANLDKLKTKIIHFVPQHEFICDKNSNLIVDLLFSFDILDEVAWLDPVFYSLHSVKNNETKSKKVLVLSETSKAKIKEVYAKDFLLYQSLHDH